MTEVKMWKKKKNLSGSPWLPEVNHHTLCINLSYLICNLELLKVILNHKVAELSMECSDNSATV